MTAAVETQNAGPGPPYRRAPRLGAMVLVWLIHLRIIFFGFTFLLTD